MLQKINAYHHLTPTQAVEQLKTDLQDALFHKVAMATFGNQDGRISQGQTVKTNPRGNLFHLSRLKGIDLAGDDVH